MAKKKTLPRKNTALVRRGGLVPAVAKVATEIRDLIEAARSHVSVTANLALVHLYWNIGRSITQDIQKNETRAEYGMALLKELASILTREYGQGYSRANLQDMRRFFEAFEICQTASSISSSCTILQPLAGESKLKQMCQPVASKSVEYKICQTVSSKLPRTEMPQTASAESCERLLIDFRKHFRLGWSHYRLLLRQGDLFHRAFYFEQAAEQRWPVRELQRQIDRGLFERVALSRDTPRLVAQEKRTGPAEVVRYEDIFKDPYVLDFLGLKGAYSEKDLEAAIVHNLEQFLSELGTDFCFIGRQHVELLLRDGPHKMKVAEYLTRLPDKRLLEERLKMYGRLLRERN